MGRGYPVWYTKRNHKRLLPSLVHAGQEILALPPRIIGIPMADILSLEHPVLHLAVAARLRTLIVEGELAAGEKLNERELSARLSVSRTPLREALKLLTAEGLVEHLPNRGAVVSQLDADAVAHRQATTTKRGGCDMKCKGIAALCLAALPAAAAAETFSAIVVAGHPPVFRWVQMIDQAFVPAVAAALEGTGHGVPFTGQYGGAIAGVGDELETVEAGLAQIGICQSLFDPAKLAVLNVTYYTPFVSDDPRLVSELMDRLQFETLLTGITVSGSTGST